MSNCAKTAILGTLSGTNLAAGLGVLARYYSAIDSIRDAVYAHAGKITPEVIDQANELVSNIGSEDFYMALLNLGVAGLGGACTYYYASRRR